MCVCVYIHIYIIFGLATEGIYWANTRHVMISSDDWTRPGEPIDAFVPAAVFGVLFAPISLGRSLILILTSHTNVLRMCFTT